MRFWRFVEKSEGDGCWLWTSCRVRSGYGAFGVNGKKLAAHRVSYEMHFGPILDGLWVLHRCDNKHCVRPDHLFLGTHEDNMRDMASKGRAVAPNRGCELNTRAKLSDQTVAVVRQRADAGASTSELAREFGVDRTTIRSIRRGRS
jgi:hypothetical protein